jgi:ribosome-associated toxin RatA of RatAB toxin-antitoxin module
MSFRAKYTCRDDVHTIEAQVNVFAPGEIVWGILTDYESIYEFIPGMVKSKVLDMGEGGGAILEQEGSVSIFPFTFNSRIVLRVKEVPMRRINFEMIEGDFASYKGHWSLKRESDTITLRLVIKASYLIRIPRFIISQSLKSLARKALSSIAEEAESRAGWTGKVSVNP